MKKDQTPQADRRASDNYDSKDLEYRIPAEVLEAEAKRRDRRPAPEEINNLTDMLHLPRLDGGFIDTVIRYAPHLMLIAAITTAVPALTVLAGVGSGSDPGYAMASLGMAVMFGLSFIWLADGRRLGLYTAALGLTVHAASAALANLSFVALSIIELIVGFSILAAVRDRYQ